MQDIVLITISPNQTWDVYAWRNGSWSELVGLFETEQEADVCAASYNVQIAKNLTTEQASILADELFKAQLCNQQAA